MNRTARTAEEAADAAFAHLMALDPNAPRAKLRDLVRTPDAKLAARCAKFLSLSPEFKPQPVRLEDRPLPREPRFPAWTNARRQSPCLPFETGRTTLPGMEPFLKGAAGCQSFGADGLAR